MVFDAFATNCSSHTGHAPPWHLPRTYTKVCLHSWSCKQPHQPSWFGSVGIFLRFAKGATNDSPRWRLMRLRPTAAPTLATHLRDTFPCRDRKMWRDDVCSPHLNVHHHCPRCSSSLLRLDASRLSTFLVGTALLIRSYRERSCRHQYKLRRRRAQFLVKVCSSVFFPARILKSHLHKSC